MMIIALITSVQNVNQIIVHILSKWIYFNNVMLLKRFHLGLKAEAMQLSSSALIAAKICC